jgi:ABC-type transporter Mla MlaB component
MLKITRMSVTAEQVTLRVEGRIVAANVVELERECRAAVAAGQRLVLDLGGVTYLDGAGAAMLRSLPPGHCEFVNGSEFLEQLLGVAQDATPASSPRRSERKSI